MTRREELPWDRGSGVRVRLGSGTVRLVDGEPGTVVVEVAGRQADRCTVTADQDGVVVEGPRGALRWAPHDVVVRAAGFGQVDAKLASADLYAAAAVSALDADLASGDVRLGTCTGRLQVRSASGGVLATHVGGDATVTTASGGIRIGQLGGDATVTTASGDVRVDGAAGRLAARSASGSVRLGSYAGTDLSVSTVSGDVEVGFPTGRELDADLRAISGEVRSRFPDDAGTDVTDPLRVRVRLRSTSGDIVIGPAGTPSV